MPESEFFLLNEILVKHRAAKLLVLQITKGEIIR